MNIFTGDPHDTNTVVFFATRTDWSIKVRQLGRPFNTLAHGAFSPNLEFDRDYLFEFSVTDDAVTVSVPGAENVTKKVSTAEMLGNQASWQEYPVRPPAAQVFDFDKVWAIEEGQPLFPVPDAG